MPALPLMLLAAAAPAEAPPPPDEIVVRGSRWKCHVEYADRTMSDREFDRRAAQWAGGVPVRVIVPRSADRQCLVRIAFRLSDRGVKLIEFVDPSAPAP